MSPFSGCLKITSAVRATLMWADCVIPLGQYFATHQANRRLLRGADFLSLVFPEIQTSPAVKPGVRARCPNVLQDHLVAPQRFASPVRADQAEHAVINRIPLRRSRRVMRHRDRQSKFVRESLQSKLPFPFAVVVCPTAVHFDQQPILVVITPASNIEPPALNGCDFKALASLARCRSPRSHRCEPDRKFLRGWRDPRPSLGHHDPVPDAAGVSRNVLDS